MTHNQLHHRFEALQPELEARFRLYRLSAADLLAYAWQYLAGASDADRCTAASLAHFSAKRWRRQRARGGRDILTHRDTRGHRVTFHEGLAACPDHAEVTAWREHWERWLGTLRPRDRLIVDMLGSGEKARAVAASLGITPGRVSQLRADLWRDWQSHNHSE